MKEIKGNIYKLRRDATQAGENLAIYPNQGKKIAKRFKSRHLKFNRKIKEYQNKCKAVEKMLKGGVLLTD